MKYTIEDLFKIFESHSEEYEKQKERYDFNLSEALKTICSEIINLKNENE